MRKIILQHAVGDQIPLLDLVKPTNQAYADKFGFEYLTDSTIRCTDRLYYWEKIAWLKELLPTIEDGSLVVWEDADSLNLGNESFETALPAGGVFGMVQNRAGLNLSKLIPWYNSGVMVIINSAATREFINQAWDKGGNGDEDGIIAVLKENNWNVGTTPLSSIDPKWNCWLNNEGFCPSPVVKTWHGIILAKKLEQIQEAVAIKT